MSTVPRRPLTTSALHDLRSIRRTGVFLLAFLLASIASLSMSSATPSLTLNGILLGQDDRNANQSFGADDPPWLVSGDQGNLPAVAMTHPLDALVGIEPSEFERLLHGEEVIAEGELILKLLFRVPQIGLSIVDQFVGMTSSQNVSALPGEDDEFRAMMFSVRGIARMVETVSVPVEVAERFEFEQFYQVLIQDRQTARWTRVYCRRIPTGWRVGELIEEPTGFEGLFVVMDGRPANIEGESNDEAESIPLFVADRLKWYPTRERDGISAGLKWLAACGMDVNLFAEIAASDRAPLTSNDSECFYQLLVTSTQSPDDESGNWPSIEPIDLLTLMRDPSKHRGDRFEISGNIRRITRVEISDPYIQNRLQIDHYFQIDIFVPLKDNQVVRLSENEQGEAPTFRGKYPVTVCVTRLPEGIEPTDDINVQASFDAFFFKLWSYPSQYVEGFDSNMRQVGPLFVASDFEITETQSETMLLTMIAGTLLLASLGIAWFGAWALGKRSSQPIVGKTEAEADPSFLRELEQHVDDSAEP